MALNAKQRGVLGGMAIGASTAVVLIAAGIALNPFGYSPELDFEARITVALESCLLPAFFLAVCIGRLAKHRFFTPEDIDGSGTSEGTQQARVLQSLLQNTLEQGLLAALIYLAWSVVMPPSWLSAVPMAAIAFSVGRILFFAGYAKGAPSRAIGFTLAFYPSLGMLLCLVVFILWNV
jgi:hypothetical protein